jgi:hypothetical protein
MESWCGRFCEIVTMPPSLEAFRVSDISIFSLLLLSLSPHFLFSIDTFLVYIVFGGFDIQVFLPLLAFSMPRNRNS